MDSRAYEMNDLLVGGYEKVMAMEQRLLSGMPDNDLTISEMHMIEHIFTGGEDGRTIGDIATWASKAPPSITVAIKKLEARGYVEKVKNLRDGRIVHVKLTRRGRRAEISHRYFHRKLVSELIGRMTSADEDALIKGLRIINEYLDHTLADLNKTKGSNT